MSHANFLLVFLILSSTLAATRAVAGDPAAGKLKAEQQQCNQCHRSNDFNGETTAALESLISAINTGKIPHDKKAFHLNQTEIADIAAYWTTRSNKR
jgi:mono/diheme cytochrome c family protein